jgi:hypothetical protein
LDKVKAAQVAKCIEKVFPELRVVIMVQPQGVGGPMVIIHGGGKGYSFAIRVKLNDFERLPPKAVAEAFIEKLTQVQREKKHGTVLRRR